MSLLSDRPSSGSSTPSIPPGSAADSGSPPGRDAHRPIALVGMYAAIQAALVGLLLAVVPAVAIWVATARVSAPWSQAARVGVQAWLVGNGSSLALSAGEFTVLPLGLALPVLWLSWYAAGRVQHAVLREPSAGRLRSGALAFIGTYAVIAVAAAAVTGSTAARAPLGSALLGSLVVSGLSLAIASYWSWRPQVSWWPRLELGVRAVGVALLGWLGLALVGLVAAVASGFSRIVDVQQALHPGGLGHLLLALLQVLAVPTAWAWSAAYATGDGFSVGAGTWVSPHATEFAPLPAFPLLGALPQPGAHSVATFVLPAFVILAGCLAGYWWRSRRGDVLVGIAVLEALGIAVGTALAGALLASLSAGAVGPGRMAEIGPSAFGVFTHLLLEIGAGALLGAFAGPYVASGRAGQAARGGARVAGRLTRSAGRQLADQAGERSLAGARKARRVAGRAGTRLGRAVSRTNAAPDSGSPRRSRTGRAKAPGRH